MAMMVLTSVPKLSKNVTYEDLDGVIEPGGVDVRNKETATLRLSAQ